MSGRQQQRLQETIIRRKEAMMPNELLQQVEQIIAEEQAHLARLPLLQAEIQEAWEMLGIAREAGLTELAERLSSQVARLETLYEQEQASAARRIAGIEALRPRL